MFVSKHVMMKTELARRVQLTRGGHFQIWKTWFLHDNFVRKVTVLTDGKSPFEDFA